MDASHSNQNLPISESSPPAEILVPARWRRLAAVALWGVTAVYFLFAVLVLALRYWILPNVTHYAPEIERAVSRTIGERVAIGGISATWQGIRPELDLTQVKIFDRGGREALSLPAVEAVIAWRSVVFGALHFRSLTLEQPNLEIRRDELGRIFVAGIELRKDDTGPDISDWLLSQREIVIRNARLSWDDALRRAPMLELVGLTLVVHNDDALHRFALKANTARDLASTLDVRGELRGGGLAELQRWTGRLFVELDYADLAAWRQWFDYPLELRSGQGGIRLWLGVAGKKLTEATADVALAKVSTRIAPELPELQLDYLRGRLGYKASGNAMDISGRSVALRSGGGVAFEPADFTLHLEPGRDARPAKGEFQANALELEPLAKLAEYLPFPGGLRQRLSELEPHGQVFDLRYSWTGEPDAPHGYHLRGRFSALGMKAHGKLPGFAGATGNVDASDRGGNLFLSSEKVTIDLPRILAEDRAQLDSLTAQVGWLVGKDRLELKFANLSVANRDVAGTLFGSFATKEGSPGVIDLTGQFPRADARFVYRYIPWLPAAVRDYVKSAVVSGQASDVRLRLKGDLSQFPFDNGKRGLLQVVAKVNGVDLEYADKWPKLAGAGGEIAFEGMGMQIIASRGAVLGARVTNTRAVIPDLFKTDPQLRIDGAAEGPTAEFLHFIDASPVGAYIDHFTEGWRVAGAGRVALKLDLPIARPDQVKVSGGYQFVNNQITIDAAIPQFSQASGRVDFTENSVSMRGVQAQFLGGPTALSAFTRPDGTVMVTAQGTAQAGTLRKLANTALLDRASGAAAWRGAINLRKGLFDVTIESSLQGVAIDLPAPLGKAASESMPLRLERSNNADSEWVRRVKIARFAKGGDAIGVTLGQILSAVLVRRREGERMVVDRGAVGLPDLPLLPERPAIVAAGSLGYLDYDRWRSVLGEGAGDGAELSALDFDIGVLDVAGKRLHKVSLHAGGSGGIWNANLTSREFAGAVIWRPEGRGRIQARLKYFTVPEAAPGAATEAPSRELPELDIVAENFVLGDKKLGKLELIANNQARDWRIDKLILTGPESVLSADGVWQSWAARPSIGLAVKLDVQDVGGFLTRMGFPGTVRRGTAKLEGKMGWAGNPQSIDYPTLTGNLTLAAERGQFLKAEPGVAKLIGILSLQTWITLDFRDLFGEGFAFDSLSGTAAINKGMLHTDDFRMKGPSAQVSMTGDIDLARETQALRVRVVPSVGDSVSSVAGILLAHPVWGIGALLAQRILKDPLGQIFSFEYGVTGTWGEPKVERVRADVSKPAPAQQ